MHLHAFISDTGTDTHTHFVGITGIESKKCEAVCVLERLWSWLWHLVCTHTHTLRLGCGTLCTHSRFKMTSFGHHLVWDFGVVVDGCLLACICPPLHGFSFNVSLSPFIMSDCQFILFQYSLFLSFHHLYCFSFVSFSFHLPLLLFLSFCFPFIMVPRPLHCILSFACSSSPSRFEPAHTFLCFAFIVFVPFIYHLIFHSRFGCFCRVGIADACLLGFWGAAGVCNDHGKTYALYAITVSRRNQDGSEDCWKTYRRYSDFHDFHMRITEQVCASYDVFTQKEQNINVNRRSKNSSTVLSSYLLV